MKKITLLLVSCATTLFCSAHADTIKLSGIVRDFHIAHPDFERDICGEQTGLVADTLGADSKPTFGSNGKACIKSASTFSQWYNDSVANRYIPLTIMLDNGQEAPGGYYTYRNNSFFPIDGKLFGNEGNQHNYHFTYELHSFFTYTSPGTFTFGGSNVEMWVFINGKLVVDIGGILSHSEGGVSRETILFIDGGRGGDFTVGSRYPIDIFVANRHTDTNSSQFKMITSIAIESSPDVIGCIKMKSAPIKKMKVLARQNGEVDQVTVTDNEGCYQFSNIISDKQFQVIIKGPMVP